MIRQEREKEIQAIEDLKKSERERLEIQRIELTQGKEAAKVKELMNKGVDAATAKAFAAEQAALDKLKADKDKKPEQQKEMQKLTASESRLLTRGTATSLPEIMQQILGELKETRRQDKTVKIDPQQMKIWDDVRQNTSNTMQMEAIA
jgi:hypothetical protein